MFVRFATTHDQDRLRSLYLDAGMDIAGDIEEHLVLVEGENLIGGGMLQQTTTTSFHLLLLAIAEEQRGTGTGGRLLEEMINNPWDCCSLVQDPSEQPYVITTVAKGVRKSFYRKHGFVPCAFSELVDPFREQCLLCPEYDSCRPVAMRFEKSAKLPRLGVESSDNG